MNALPPSPLPQLTEGAFTRAFPFYLYLDANLCVRSAGPSLRKAYPAVLPGASLQALFTIRRPRAINSVEDWRSCAREPCILASLNHQALTLRGSAEMYDDGVLLLVSPVLASLEEVTGLKLGFSDFAQHDASCDSLLLAETSRALQADTARMAVRLRSRTEQLSTMIELSQNGVVYFDAGLLLQHVNSALLEMFGLTRLTAFDLGLAALDAWIGSLLVPDQARQRPLDAVMGSQTDCLRGLVFHIARPQPAAIHLDSARTQDGGWVFYLRNVTHEFELDRMKSEFLQAAAHELRTPMVSVYGFTELLLNRPVTEVQRRDMLETIHRQSKMLIHMINEMLDLARIEAGQDKNLTRTPCRLGPLIDQAVALFEQPGSIEQRLQVNLLHAETLLVVDADHILRALTNVLSNAYKYSPNGGVVTVDTLEGTLRGDSALGLRVTDHGIGMTAEQQARVCERFYRADTSGHIPGTGLGMSLVKEIVELHGGRVEVCSQVGSGTAVTLWFPLGSPLPTPLPTPLMAPDATALAFRP